MALTTPAPAVLADALPGSAVRDVALVLGGAAFVGLAAQVAIPLPYTPVPVTGQTFAVLLTGAALGSLRGLISMAIYAIAGMIGMPWFSGGSTAFDDGSTPAYEGSLTPSFGYILGFVAAAALVGFLAERGWTRTPWLTAAAMVLGNVVIYSIGVVWLKFALESSMGAPVTWVQAYEWGMEPFLGGDALKIILAAGLFPVAWLGLKKLGLAPREEPASAKKTTN